MATKEKSISIKKAAIKYDVPEQTLRYWCKGKIEPETVKSGPQPVLSMEHEAKLVEHIQSMASVGYGYTRAEVIQLGTEYAQQLGLRGEQQPLTKHWFYNVLARWPELKVINPKSLSEVRAKVISRESVKLFQWIRAYLTEIWSYGQATLDLQCWWKWHSTQL